MPSCHRQTLASVREETGSVYQCGVREHNALGDRKGRTPTPALLREGFLEHSLSKEGRTEGARQVTDLEVGGTMVAGHGDPAQDLSLNKGKSCND